MVAPFLLEARPLLFVAQPQVDDIAVREAELGPGGKPAVDKMIVLRIERRQGRARQHAQHQLAPVGVVGNERIDHAGIEVEPVGMVGTSQHRAPLRDRERAEPERQRLDHHQAAADDFAAAPEQDRLVLDGRPTRFGKGIQLLLADLVELRDRTIPQFRRDDFSGNDRPRGHRPRGHADERLIEGNRHARKLHASRGKICPPSGKIPSETK